MKMKLRIIACGIVLCIIGANATAQKLTQNIRGKIIDVDSKLPLIGVTLIIEGSDPAVGTASGTTGEFSIKDLPIGRYNILTSYVGYESKMVPNLLLGAGKEVYLNIEMAESVTKLEEITVTNKKNKSEVLNDMATVSARSFTVEETQRFAGSFADPSRMVSSYAGVVGDPDGNNNIIIRGNSPKGLLWRVEGVDVPNPNHFANEGATGGPISILNSTTLSNSDFMTGAFPADYGDAYSGVFDINLRNGNNEKNEYTIQAGLIGLEMAAEGPFSNDNPASYLVNYRYSSVALLNEIGVKVAGDAIPKFQDLTFNINAPTTKFGTFQLFGIGGISTIRFNESDFYEDFRMDMGVVGLNHILPISDKTYLKTSFSTSASLGEYQYKELNDETTNKELRESQNLDYISHRVAVEISHKLSAKNSLKAGVSTNLKTYDLVMNSWDDDVKKIYTVLDENGDAELVQSFIAWKFRPVESLTINSGIHYTYLTLNGNQSVEPRAGIRWQVSPRQAITAGFGQHSKMESISLYLFNVKQENDVYVQPNKDLDFIKAYHYVLGYECRISQNLNLKAEAYIQDLYSVPVENDSLSAFSMLNEDNGYVFENLVNKGTGKNYGVELTVEKYFSKKYYFLVTSSIYNSKFTPMDGIERNSRYNGKYAFNLVGGKEIPLGHSGNNTLAFNIRTTVAGGQYYSPIDPIASAEKGYTYRQAEDAYTKKRPDFFRADMKISYRKNKKHSTRSWELDIQNVSNTLNVTGDYWDNSEKKIVEYTQLGILPVINYRVEF